MRWRPCSTGIGCCSRPVLPCALILKVGEVCGVPPIPELRLLDPASGGGANSAIKPIDTAAKATPTAATKNDWLTPSAAAAAAPPEPPAHQVRMAAATMMMNGSG